ncbi:MAG: PQQ-binding-like beta-propeller repeat protein [Verrucomicrobiota bacterium]
MKPLILIGLASLAIITPRAVSGAFDWPQWQGPGRDGVSKETGLLQEWPKDGPPLAWSVKGLGGGDSTPSVAAGRIYGMSHRGADEVVWALSEKDGKEIWAVRIAPAHSQSWNQSKEGPACTPTVDGNLLYVMGLAGNVVCLQAADGKVVWTRNLRTDFGGKSPMWSYRESPLVDGDKVICTPGGDETTMVALNRSSGATLWKTFVPDRGAAGGQTPNRPPAPNMPNVMRMDPMLSSLDKDQNNEISAGGRANVIL